ncbi:helicase-related protein [Pseudokineococcus basanitobsidens]|uniref:helicase-related protein n=1 Tax=Pseudokineococcus basanitobsidens TaxID=1926649 RepID=UPI003BB4EFA0
MTEPTTPQQRDAARTIAPGSVVVVRDEEWLVRATEQTPTGLLVRVQGLGQLVRDAEAVFYDSLDDIGVLDPADAVVVGDDSPQYRTARLWLESTVRKTAVPLADTTLDVSLRSLADTLGYQETAVRTALDPNNLRPRILLADAVGLGKTIEIGMILSELVRRGRGERILIVTPRHVLEQMQHEMWSRFALPFVRLDSAGIQRIRQMLPATRNPFTYFKRVIVSIDTLKSDRYVAHLSKQRWDAVVIDESHNLSNAATKNNKLATTLARQTDALVLASATPHNGRAESFAELVRLLDPTAVRPDGELDKGEVARLVVRRHRHSDEVAQVVGNDWAERQEPNTVLVDAAPAEDAVARELDEVWLHPQGSSPYSGQNSSLFPWTLAKAFLSSPVALLQSIRDRRARLGAGAAADTERAALDRLRALAEASRDQPSAKYDALVKHLRSAGVGKGSTTRAVVFAERVVTLGWLQEKLVKDLGLPADAVDVLHGGLPDEEQQRVVEAFKQAATPVRVLVTGDVASEGVNLHAQCHELVHYDIPWSLIRIEQRNGRIDRYGQKHPPRITTLALKPSSEGFSGDIRVLTRLVEREHEAHRALGDAASLMGAHSVAAEEESITQVLAGRRRLDDVVRTVEDARADDDLLALMDDLGGGDVAPVAAPAARAGTGLYGRDDEYLDEALHAAYPKPEDPVARGGVAWRRFPQHGAAELEPPRDLVARLDVLPQTYLADRGVTQKLVLATTPQRGDQSLAEARADAVGSSWPEAHYLGPLHPVLEWASDKALASLGRNQVFAVRGDVETPTVLLLGTLTNRRGQVVTAAWLTAHFPTGGTEPLFVEPHESARDALAAVGWTTRRTNPGAVDATQLTALVAPAVRDARRQMEVVADSALPDLRRRVEAWVHRLEAWDEDAGALIQRGDLKDRRRSVKTERELVEEMRPDRQLVRPLLVVVPETGA